MAHPPETSKHPKFNGDGGWTINRNVLLYYMYISSKLHCFAKEFNKLLFNFEHAVYLKSYIFSKLSDWNESLSGLTRGTSLSVSIRSVWFGDEIGRQMPLKSRSPDKMADALAGTLFEDQASIRFPNRKGDVWSAMAQFSSLLCAPSALPPKY